MSNAKQTIGFSKASPLQIKQRGLVLIVTLLALVILLLASVALIRSTDTNLQIAGNMAFKRDAMNQAERAIPQIKKLFTSGALSGVSVRHTNSDANNYYATIQPTNASGIPEVLFNITANKIAGENDVEVTYVIDRMCLSDGPADDIYDGRCALAKSNGNDFGPENELFEIFPIYRITLRATGPKNTVAYLQTTFTD